ncbi:hypothetical protein GOBAR_DD28693 [Gossypium barbadense]|nr:hypothetical protein GOBAR_DD28693 [Gossypium barbadense]
MNTQGMQTWGMKTCGKQGQGTQIDSSTLQVHTPGSIAKHVEHAPATNENQHEVIDDVVSQGMLRVLQ